MQIDHDELKEEEAKMNIKENVDSSASVKSETDNKGKFAS